MEEEIIKKTEVPKNDKEAKEPLKARAKEWLKFSGSLILGIAVLVGVILLFRYKDEVKQVIEDVSPNYYLTTISTIQDGKFKVIAYDQKKEKYYEIITGDVENGSNFTAEVSNQAKKIAYSTSKGVYLYDLVSKETKSVIDTVPEVNENGGRSGYSLLVWSKDGKRLAVGSKTSYSSVVKYIVNMEDNNRLTEISAGTSFAWLNNGYAFLAKSNSYMDEGGGISISDENSGNLNPLFEDIQKSPSFQSVLEAKNDRIYFIGSTPEGENGYTYYKNRKLLSTKNDGTDLKEYLIDNELQGDIVYDGSDKIYFTKTENSSDGSADKGKGVFSMTLDGEISQVLDTTDVVNLSYANSDEVAFLTSGKIYGDESALYQAKIFYLDKSTLKDLGRANVIDLSGLVGNSYLSDNLTETTLPVATEEEINLYNESLKSLGYLYGRYYDFCWDYDCKSQTYPYPAKLESTKPERIKFGDGPEEKLTGNVSVPVVFAYDGEPIPSDQIDVMKDSSVANSFAAAAKWLNDQAKTHGQKLNFSFDYKSEQVDLTLIGECQIVVGTSTQYDPKCVKQKVFSKYSDLQNLKKIYLVLGINTSDATNQSKYYSWAYDYTLPSMNMVDYRIKTSKMTWVDGSAVYDYPFLTKDEFKTAVEGRTTTIFGVYTIKSLLKRYGMSEIIPNGQAKSPSGENVTACYLNVRDDISCGMYWENGSVVYPTALSELKIGTVTAKEFGWFDADGDKKNEADDVCPYNAKNDCES